MRVTGRIATSPSERYCQQDLAWSSFKVTPGGMRAVPQGSGIGLEVDEKGLVRVTVRRLGFPNQMSEGESSVWSRRAIDSSEHNEQTVR